jgi:hypothetical protein
MGATASFSLCGRTRKCDLDFAGGCDPASRIKRGFRPARSALPVSYDAGRDALGAKVALNFRVSCYRRKLSRAFRSPVL